ncbi:hypothetical protein CEUSTIGMA_g2271.t1 [Chlamydomonas eustigma]|uniref:Tubulin--tyrosine ligase-like protein 5 n=1 Tax=Chlamydomonas eustigma TaxID=1157962 RepID=A0A250WVF5_9CHLO|nr:hypothetical protein CEUSTIGMA_g2271.t1 [Chlamydomonas eustigma]|eukprot:GAX74824.1 hypothetical protein CEUSTIGMA_g2271.t1 [Chlamydomonas eustigma]
MKIACSIHACSLSCSNLQHGGQRLLSFPLSKQRLDQSNLRTMPKRKLSQSKILGCSRNPQSAVGAPRAKNLKTGQAEEKGIGKFRFWTDARRFKGSEEKCIVQKALYEAGGVRIGGYPKASPIPGPLGFQRPEDWDFLWAPARLALKALPARPGQLVSACPGMMSLTRKRQLSMTLKGSLGEDLAFSIIPRTFSLPDELEAFKKYLEKQRSAKQVKNGSAAEEEAAGRCKELAVGNSAAASDRNDLWILKTAQHLGKGLKLVTADEAVREAAKRRLKSKKAKPYVQAQQYVANPLLIQDRKFGIRVWVLVTGLNPYRVYLHCNGLVLFSTHQYSSETWRTEEGEVALGHVTNYAQNMDGMVWDLKMLEDHLGKDAFDTLWCRIARNTAMVFSSALPQITLAHEALSVQPESTFELLGLDYLVDDQLHPWLLEVNGTPSLAVEHEDLKVEAIISKQKNEMVSDMVKTLNLASRFEPRYTSLRLAATKTKSLAAISIEGSEVEEGRSEHTAVNVMSDAADGQTTSSDPQEDEEADIAGVVQNSSMDVSTDGEVSGAAVASKNSTRQHEIRDAAEHNFTEESALHVVSGGSSKTVQTVISPADRIDHLRRQLREEMAPTTDKVVWFRVRQELQQLGGFQPLMPMFPMKSKSDQNVSGHNMPWKDRDNELVSMLGKTARLNKRAAIAAEKKP